MKSIFVTMIALFAFTTSAFAADPVCQLRKKARADLLTYLVTDKEAVPASTLDQCVAAALAELGTTIDDSVIPPGGYYGYPVTYTVYKVYYYFDDGITITKGSVKQRN